MQKRTLFFSSLAGLLMCSAALTVPCYSQLSTKNKRAERFYEESKKCLQLRDFDRAIKKLEEAIRLNPNFLEAHFALGNAFNTLQKVQEAEFHYRKCIEISPEDRKLASVYYQLGIMDFSRGNYRNALAELEKFLAMNSGRSSQVQEAQKRIASCKYALESMKKPLPFKPVALPAPLNLLPLQYFPVLSADQEQIVFTGRHGITMDKDEDIYISYFRNGSWTMPEAIKELCTSFNEGTCTISADGKIMIFTICDNQIRPTLGSCDLFITKRLGDHWSEPQNLGPAVNSSHWDTQPALSPDGRTLYFVSDRPGGIGGHDIWVTYLQEDGQWSQAVNLGPSINTRNDELSPFMHANNRTLFFASDRHPTHGGYDLFKSERTSTGWDVPVNLGYPLNDHRNQMGIFITPDGKRGYFSNEEAMTNVRVSSKIYVFDVPEEIRPSVVTNYLKGTVRDAVTKKPLDATIELIALNTDSLQQKVVSDGVTGKYLIVLNKGAEYALYVNRQGYLFKSLTFDYQKVGQDVEIDIELEPINKGARVVLNNIFFETGKWNLLPKSITELRKLLKLMQDNPQLSIEIGAHTDDIGSHEFNMELSRKRAQAVVDFLVQHGISSSRIIAKGYGETMPQVSNDSEENRAKNRRVEFKLL